MSTYDTDFYAWTQAQAAALRAKDVAALALDHLAEETGLPLATFPETCPWGLAQVLDEDFWPEG
jgi:uncharacterized protein YbaP (TraB family)